MKKATIEFEDGTLIFDGVKISLDAIPQVLYELAHPDPRKWYNFERLGHLIIVHVEMREVARPVTDYPIPTEVINGNYVSERSPSVSSEGSEAPNPLDEH